MALINEAFDTPFSEEISFAIVNKSQKIDYRLHPEEERCLSESASIIRREEFRLGRTAAHLALKKLLQVDKTPPVLKGAHREPIWPDGVVGSITHCDNTAMCVVAPADLVVGVGIDLENMARARESGIVSRICTYAEQGWLATEEDRPRKLIQLFSAKESIFKAMYPVVKRALQFHEVELYFDHDEEIFVGDLTVDCGYGFTPGYRFYVGCDVSDQYVLTYCVL